MKYTSVIIAGPPSVGKGTQCDLLVNTGHFFHLSTGEEFARLLKKKELSSLERKIVEANVDGNYVPDNLVMEYFGTVIENYKKGISEDRRRYVPDQHTLLLDGIPRTEEQRLAIDRSNQFDILAVIRLEAQRETLLKRVLERKQLNRPDDKHIEKRIHIYFDRTHNVLEKYGPKLVRIDTTPRPGKQDSKQEVHADIMYALGYDEKDPIEDIFAEASEMPASGRTFNGKVPARYDLGTNHQGQTRAVFKTPNPE